MQVVYVPLFWRLVGEFGRTKLVDIFELFLVFYLFFFCKLVFFIFLIFIF